MRRIVPLVLAALLTLSACGTSSEGDAGSDASGSSASGSSGAKGSSQVKGTGKTADLGFTATTLEGDSFEGSTLAGKPTVLWFWAPWCPTCRAQIPTVSGLAEKYDGTVNVVGVGGLDTQGAIEDLAADIDGVTHLVDDEGAVWKHFRVTAQSTYTVLDADGQIVHEGYLDDDEIEDLVATLAG